MSDNFVSLSDLTLSYGQTVAVPNLNLDVVEGELICPESGVKFPIKNGIPNMLLQEE
jgi:uncharacterized protein YbaR (Trm112 family)